MWHVNTNDYEADTLPELVSNMANHCLEHDRDPIVNELYFEDAYGCRSTASHEAVMQLEERVLAEMRLVSEQAEGWHRQRLSCNYL